MKISVLRLASAPLKAHKLPISSLGSYLAALVIIAFFSAQQSYASPSCSGLFTTNTSRPVLTYDVVPSLALHMKRKGQTKEMIDELFYNRVSKPTRELVKNENNAPKFWFISETNSGERYKLTFVSSEGRITVIFMAPVTAAMEKTYFKKVSENTEPSEYYLYRPIKGQLKFTVAPHVQTKIKEKHGLSIEEVTEAAEHFNGKYRSYTEPDSSKVTNFDRFQIQGRLGDEPVRIVFAFNQETKVLSLITAFIIDR